MGMEVLDASLQGTGIGRGSGIWWEADVGEGLGVSRADDRGVLRDRDDGGRVTGGLGLFAGVGHEVDPGRLLRTDGSFTRFVKLSAPRWAPNCFGQKIDQYVFFVDLWNQ